jgi:S-adenosylmethionine uptake transporter
MHLIIKKKELPMEKFNNQKQVIIFALIGFFIFSCGDAMVKYLLQSHDIVSLLFLNALLCVCLQCFLSPFFGGLKRVFKTPQLKLHMIRASISFCQIITAVLAFNHLPLTTAYAILFTAPFISSFLAIPLLGQKVSIIKVGVILMGFLGALIVLRPTTIPLNMGVFYAFICAVTFAIVGILNGIIHKNQEKHDYIESPLSFSIFPFILVALGSFPFAIQHIEPISLSHLGLIFINACFCFLGMVLVSYAFAHGKISTIAPTHYSQIIWGILFGYVLFGDKVDLWMVLGCVLIVIAGVLLVRLKDPDPQSIDG